MYSPVDSIADILSLEFIYLIKLNMNNSFICSGNQCIELH
uniref:Uncharacterized protein n=1 Tax=Anguilla anguilla TaxID=7936 RepID=A0A0E9PE02_ANGAN